MNKQTHEECFELLYEAQARLVNAIHDNDFIELANSVSALIEANRVMLACIYTDSQ